MNLLQLLMKLSLLLISFLTKNHLVLKKGTSLDSRIHRFIGKGGFSHVFVRVIA